MELDSPGEERAAKEDDIVVLRPFWMMEAKVAICDSQRVLVGAVWRDHKRLLEARVVKVGDR